MRILEDINERLQDSVRRHKWLFENAPGDSDGLLRLETVIREMCWVLELDAAELICPVCSKRMKIVSWLGTRPIWNHDNPCNPYDFVSRQGEGERHWTWIEGTGYKESTNPA